MNCKKCGNILNETDTFCKICGEPVGNGDVVNQGGVVTNQQVSQVQSMQTQPAEQVMPAQQPVQAQTVEQIVPVQSQTQEPAASIQQVPIQQSVQPQPVQPMQQPVQPVQQPMYGAPNNMMSQNMGQQPAPKKNNLFMILLIILLIAILGLGSFIGYKLLSKDDTKTSEKQNKDTDKNKDKDKDKDKDKEDDEEEEEKPIASEKNIFESSGYKFTIPSDLKYQNEDGLLTFSDSKTYQATMAVDFYSYDKIVLDQTSVKEELQTLGLQIVDQAEMTKEGRKFYLFEVSYSGQYAIFYFTKLDDYYSAIGLIVATTSEGYETSLKYVANIVETANRTSIFAPGESEEPTPKITIDNKLFENADIQGSEFSVK